MLTNSHVHVMSRHVKSYHITSHSGKCVAKVKAEAAYPPAEKQYEKHTTAIHPIYAAHHVAPVHAYHAPSYCKGRRGHARFLQGCPPLAVAPAKSGHGPPVAAAYVWFFIILGLLLCVCCCCCGGYYYRNRQEQARQESLGLVPPKGFDYSRRSPQRRQPMKQLQAPMPATQQPTGPGDELTAAEVHAML
jgi:hypothetical protein